MAAPVSIAVEVDREEYSRFESDKDTILVTLDVKGSSLVGEVLTVQIKKARRDRSEILTSREITLTSPVDQLLQVSFEMNDIINEKAIPMMRRGEYFVHAESNTDPSIEGDSEDFRVSMITVDRLKGDYLHGTDQFASDQLQVLEQPTLITGVTVEDVSLGHPKASYPLSYNFSVDHIPTVTGTTTETFALADGETLVLRVDGGVAQTATFNTADFGAIGAATVAEIIAVLVTDIPDVTAEDVGGALKLTGGTVSLLVDPAGTATATLGLTGLSDTSIVTRMLSWCNGPSVIITPGKKTYILQLGDRQGTLAADYIKARVASTALLPTQSHAEKLIIERRPLDDTRMQALIDQAISWVEDVELAVYLEPTRVTTDVDANAISYPAGETTPKLVGADWDCVVDAIHYTAPASGHWISWKCPYYPILCFEELFGKLSNTRIVDIALEWIEAHEATGWIELVPFNQEVAFNFIGLVWVQSLRGPVPLPNFWNFTALVGFRKTPPIILELVAKKAAMDILSIAGQAFRGGFSSQSISRDGISESVSYTASATFGIYSATIEDYRKWIDKALKQLRGAFRGPNLVVM